MMMNENEIQALKSLKKNPNFLEQVEILRAITLKYPEFNASSLAKSADLLISEAERLFTVLQMDPADTLELSRISELESEPEQIEALVWAKEKYEHIPVGVTDLAAVTGLSKSAVSKMIAVTNPENRVFLTLLRPTKSRRAVANILATFKKLNENSQRVFFDYVEETGNLLTEQPLIKAFTYEQLGGTITRGNLETEIFGASLESLTKKLHTQRREQYEAYRNQLNDDSRGPVEIEYLESDFLTSVEAIHDLIANCSYRRQEYDDTALHDQESLLPEGELIFGGDGRNPHRIIITRKMTLALIHRLTGETNIPIEHVLFKLFSALKSLDH